MSKFKVGDKVRVIAKPPESRDHPHDYFVTSMDQYCGQIFTIDQVFSDLLTYRLVEVGWNWVDDWLEPVTDPVCKDLLERLAKCVASRLNPNDRELDELLDEAFGYLRQFEDKT